MAKKSKNSKKILSFLYLVVIIPAFCLIKLGQLPRKLIKVISQMIKITPRTKPLSKAKVGAVMLTVFILIYSLILINIASQLPSPNRLTASNRPLTTQILDREGRLLYQVYEGQNRKLVGVKELPKYLIDATVAIEDQYFFTHPGIDFAGIARAIKTNLSTGEIQGGSTITQQLIKNTLLTPDKTIKRKIEEIALALWTERLYSKQEILQMYFNEIPYGGPAWGIETAAEMYFGKKAQDLSLAESAYLAGLPAAPSEYSPYGIHPEKGKQRQEEVLRRMVEDRYITEAQAQEAQGYPLSFKPPIQNIKAPHFVMYVRDVLASKYGERVVSQGGLRVVTSLDLDIQQMAEDIVLGQIDKLTKLRVGNGAAMVTDAKTGQILAMVGSKDYFGAKDGNFNATLAIRPPGSSIKPVTYATAFKQGFSPGSVILDIPTTFTNPWGESYSPVNYDNRFHGPVSIRTALGSSYNIPAVKVLAIVGLPQMLATAKEMGITTLNEPQKYGLSLTLGGGGVKMVDMMTVYGTLANEGVKNNPTPILKVTDSFGNVLEDNNKPAGKKVLTEEVAYLLSNILSDDRARAPAFGMNSLLTIAHHTVAVKTGTSDNKRDNWTFGYTPKYVVGVWVGNNDNSPMDPHLTSGITGAAPIWHDIMAALLANEPNVTFIRPKGIIETEINGRKDLAILGQGQKVVTSLNKTKQKSEATGEEKEILTYSDPFSTFKPEIPN